MKTRIYLLATLILAATLAVFGRTAFSDDKPEQQATPDQMQAMMEAMQKWIETTKPGQPHKALDSHVGTWATTCRMSRGPGMPPIETRGVSEVKWIMGKRFLLEEHKGEMPMPDEKGGFKNVPYEGMGTMGYDVYRNMYTGTWLSNLQTNILTMSGSMDPSGKFLRMFGEMDEPMLNVTGRMVKYVTKIKDQDTRIFECYDLHPSDNYKVFEIEYKRKK